MSNLSALFSLNLGYTGPSSESTSIPPLGVYASGDGKVVYYIFGDPT